MARVLRRLVSVARDVARGIDAGHAIRHGVPVGPGAWVERDAGAVGGPFLHWVPDGDGGSRLAGELVPDVWAGRDRAPSSRPR